jgi:hypothetical protein
MYILCDAPSSLPLRVFENWQVLKERFYRPPRIGEEGEERDMADIANIVFVFIEVTHSLP